jgi:hypothetical protein
MYSFSIIHAYLFISEPQNGQGAVLGLCKYACTENICILLPDDHHQLVTEARVSITIIVMSCLTVVISCHLF